MIFITGSTGFIGDALVKDLIKTGKLSKKQKSKIESFNAILKSLNFNIDNSEFLKSQLAGVSILIHLAGKSQLNDNTEETAIANELKMAEQLADSASTAGVKKFILMSSLKVNGEATYSRPFNTESSANPSSIYGKTKLNIEKIIIEKSKMSKMDVIILRPPMVYGPNMRGNLLTLIKFVNAGFPLPFGSINNRKSFIYIKNLVDFILVCIDSKKNITGVFYLSDDDDISTTKLLRIIKEHLKVKTIFVPIPKKILFYMLKFLGKTDVATKMIDDLTVDISGSKKTFLWTPKFSALDGIKSTIDWYLKADDKIF